MPSRYRGCVSLTRACFGQRPQATPLLSGGVRERHRASLARSSIDILLGRPITAPGKA